MKQIIFAVALGVLTGCTTFRSEQTEEGADGIKRHTVVKCRSFLDSKSELSKLRTTLTDKSQGVSIGTLSQEASGTNAYSIITAVIEAAVRAAAIAK